MSSIFASRGPLRIRTWWWLWLFPTSWQLRFNDPKYSLQIGPLFFDWHRPVIKTGVKQ